MIPGRPVAQQDLRTFFSTDATLEPTGSMRVAEDFFSKGSKGNTYGDLANYLSSMFSMLEVSVPISRSKVQSSGGLFPLPESPRALEKVIGHISRYAWCGKSLGFERNKRGSGSTGEERGRLWPVWRQV